MKNLDAAITEYLATFGDRGTTEPQGATEDEIRSLETYAGGPLPQAYRTFLRRLGGYAGEMFRGTAHSLRGRSRLRMRATAERIIAESSTTLVLPETAFVFLHTQGYAFLYFDRAEGDDPAVRTFAEGDDGPTRVGGSLTGYLLRCIDDFAGRASAAGR